MKWVFLANVLGTLTMFGAIWIVQLVHYPLFALVGDAGWAGYEAQHQSRITLVVGPAMVLELATAVWLVLRPLDGIPLAAFAVGAALVGVIWLSTAFVQVPLHSALSAGFSTDAHTKLVATNWIRTAAWTLRTGLVLWMAGRLVGAAGA